MENLISARPSLSPRGLTVCLSVVCLILLTGCSVGRWHTTDAVLERNFLQHESEFESLRAKVTADGKLTMVGNDGISYAGHLLSGLKNVSGVESLGLTEAGWASYQSQLQVLKLVRITKSDDAIEFRVDEESMSNGSSLKGYWYQSTPVEHQKTNLDSYRISIEDKDKSGGYSVLKRIKKNWYLYLYVNG